MHGKMSHILMLLESASFGSLCSALSVALLTVYSALLQHINFSIVANNECFQTSNATITLSNSNYRYARSTDCFIPC